MPSRSDSFASPRLLAVLEVLMERAEKLTPVPAPARGAGADFEQAVPAYPRRVPLPSTGPRDPEHSALSRC